MFLVIQNDTINLSDVSRISRDSNTIKVYFISQSNSVEYHYDTENDASEVEYKIFKNLEEKRLIV
ncbi:hypothetical protein [Psychrobacter sp. UBA3962]|uniref:hypothetical protein n=1 Tax=Psychrobacter sp. UBA3962 TaxID=1947352 RepID=UPI0025D49CD5|nr:hypothetical protein [Psychrobacter sp. UBA3962]